MNALSKAVEVEPTHGQLQLEGRYHLDYDPDPGFVGTDSATVRLVSPAGSSFRTIVVFEVQESADLVFRQPLRLFEDLAVRTSQHAPDSESPTSRRPSP